MVILLFTTPNYNNNNTSFKISTPQAYIEKKKKTKLSEKNALNQVQDMKSQTLFLFPASAVCSTTVSNCRKSC